MRWLPCFLLSLASVVAQTPGTIQTAAVVFGGLARGFVAEGQVTGGGSTSNLVKIQVQ